MPRLARVPSKPDQPSVSYNEGIYMTVYWTEPEGDGGADITGYVIKYGDRNTDVDDYRELSVNGNTTKFQFTHQLEPQTFYRFAVAAVNSAGRGKFSEFTVFIDTFTGKRCCNCCISSL